MNSITGIDHKTLGRGVCHKLAGIIIKRVFSKLNWVKRYASRAEKSCSLKCGRKCCRDRCNLILGKIKGTLVTSLATMKHRQPTVAAHRSTMRIAALRTHPRKNVGLVFHHTSFLLHCIGITIKFLCHRRRAILKHTLGAPFGFREITADIAHTTSGFWFNPIRVWLRGSLRCSGWSR